MGGHTVFDPTRTLTNDPGRLTRQFFVGWRTMIAGVVGAEGAFRGAEVVCDIVMRVRGVVRTQLHMQGGCTELDLMDESGMKFKSRKGTINRVYSI